MAISTETTAWLEGLKKDGGLSDEQLSTIRSVVDNSKADDYIKGSQLRQSDYSRKFADLTNAKNDLTAAQTDLANKQASLDSFKDELTTWQTGAKETFQEALAAREAAETKAQKALGRLNTVAAKYGVAAEDVALEGFEPVEQKKVEGFDPEAYKKSLLAEINGSVQQAAQLDALIYDLGNEHFALFGKPLPKASELVSEAIASGTKLTDLWKSKYGVDAKRSEVAEAAINARVEREVNDRLAKAVSEGHLATSGNGLRNDPYAGSPILKSESLPRPGVDSTEGKGLSAAVAAFQVGKYKPTR